MVCVRNFASNREWLIDQFRLHFAKEKNEGSNFSELINQRLESQSGVPSAHHCRKGSQSNDAVRLYNRNGKGYHSFPFSSLDLIYLCALTNCIRLIKVDKFTKDRDAELRANPPSVPKELFFMKQYVHNACGAIALVHAIGNLPE